MAYRSCWVLGLLLCAAACGASPERDLSPGNDSTGNDIAPLVELFSWWTAPGEAESLQALVDAHELAQPNARIFNAAAASGTRARQTLTERLARNEPPDLF